MDKKTDLRIIKTKKVLFDALISLLEEMPFEEIKISDICDRALINRSTFYSHYQDKYELLSNYIYELKNALTEDLNKNDSSNNPREYYMQMISIFLDHIESKKDIYKTIMRNNKDSIRFVSLDDDFSEIDYAKYGIEDKLIHTKFFCNDISEGGLQQDHVDRAIKILMN